MSNKNKLIPNNDPIQLRNCIIGFRCTKSWDSLEKTDADDVRYCGSCRQHILFCETQSELAEAVKRNECVAFRVEEPKSQPRPKSKPQGEYLDVFMGLIKQCTDK